MDATYLLKKLSENDLHYGEQERAHAVVKALVDEVESLRKQWSEGIGKLLDQVQENKAIIDDATARMERAGL